jgi:hypothetical protein
VVRSEGAPAALKRVRESNAAISLLLTARAASALTDREAVALTKIFNTISMLNTGIE